MKKLLLVLALFGCGSSLIAYTKPLPPGSYQKNCQACSVAKGVLKCSCSTVSAHILTSLKLDNLQPGWDRDIISIYDEGKHDYILSYATMPIGSYQRSCSDCKVDDKNVLTCKCSTGFGTSNTTTLQLEVKGIDSFSGEPNGWDIENNNGTLKYVTKK